MRSKIKSRLIVFIIFTTIVILFQTMCFAATDQAAIYLSTDFSNDSDAKNAANYAGLTFRKLGYSIVTGSGANLYTMTGSGAVVRGYINGSGNNYGLYISAHGNDEWINMTKGSTDHRIYPANVTGNWHFVFLDSCSSLADDDFANAFKTTSAYSNRGILGWFNTVTTPATMEFWPYFYSFATTRSLRQCALDAASNCELSTPIRFRGDTSWYGYAW